MHEIILDCLFTAQDDAETLEAIRETMENNNGRIDDTYVIKFFRDKLKSMPCQNQGFLLDGYPKTNEQAKELFARRLFFPYHSLFLQVLCNDLIVYRYISHMFVRVVPPCNCCQQLLSTHLSMYMYGDQNYNAHTFHDGK